MTAPPSPSQTFWDFGPCGEITRNEGCFILGDRPELYGWQVQDSTESLPEFTAFTIVTVSNTVAGTARTTTIFNENYPEGFTMPDVNSDGTRITSFTFTRFGQATTTVL